MEAERKRVRKWAERGDKGGHGCFPSPGVSLLTNNLHQVHKCGSIAQVAAEVGDEGRAWLSSEVVVDPGSVVL